MTPEHDPAELTAAGLRLDTAVAQLVQPSTEQLDRAAADQDPDVREVDAEHDAESRALKRAHAAAKQHGHHAQAGRLRARLREHERQHRARRRTQAQLPSLVAQLQDAVAGTGGSNGAAGAGAHRSPIALAAAELLAGIEHAVRWGRLAHGDLPLPATLHEQLRAWAARSGHWRTTAPAYLLDAADRAEQWVSAARLTLDPPKRWTHPGACPSCGRAVAHVHDDAGQVVRRPALELDRTTATARCLGCGAWWPPDRLPLLAAVLEHQARERAAETRG